MCVLRVVCVLCACCVRAVCGVRRCPGACDVAADMFPLPSLENNHDYSRSIIPSALSEKGLGLSLRHIWSYQGTLTCHLTRRVYVGSNIFLAIVVRLVRTATPFEHRHSPFRLSARLPARPPQLNSGSRSTCPRLPRSTRRKMAPFWWLPTAALCPGRQTVARLPP